jgi:hypothetical protein
MAPCCSRHLFRCLFEDSLPRTREPSSLPKRRCLRERGTGRECHFAVTSIPFCYQICIGELSLLKRSPFTISLCSVSIGFTEVRKPANTGRNRRLGATSSIAKRKMNRIGRFLFLVLFVPLSFATTAAGQTTQAAPTRATSLADAKALPGKGMAQHPFLYCGEWQNRSISEQAMYVVRDGRVVWSYTNARKGELDDCTMLGNGNVLFARQFGASEVTPDKKVVWNYDSPPGTEIHTAYPLPGGRVLLMQNGNPAKLLVINKATNETEKQLVLPTRSASVHGQFRHVRMTLSGTVLVAHLDLGKVVEYDTDGKELWSVPAPSAWAAVRLKNGNTLISGNQHGYVREVNPKGETVWEIDKDDLPGIPLYTVQEVSRLANGNTLINNWPGSLPAERWPDVVQLIEVTAEKKVIWALRDWTILGPASSTQLLDEPETSEPQR